MISVTLGEISSKIKLSPEKGIPVVVFNSLGWERSDPASFKMSFDKGWGSSLQLFDNKGSEVPVQLSEVVRHDDGSLKSAVADFVADSIPSIGYRTYYVRPSTDKINESATGALQQVKADGPGLFTNKFYKVRFADGGLSSLYDRELGLEMIDTSKFNAGGIHHAIGRNRGR